MFEWILNVLSDIFVKNTEGKNESLGQYNTKSRHV